MKPSAQLLLLAISFCFAACSASMQDDMARDLVRDRVSSQPTFLDQPGLQVLICGSGGPLPSPDRAAACVAIVAGGKVYVVDVGAGSGENLALWQVPGNRIAGIFLTHFHSDHITELGEYNLQSWAAGRTAPLPVYGPDGVSKVVEGFNTAYELSRGYRTAHHGADFLDPHVGLLDPKPFDISASSKAGTTVTVLDQDGLQVRAFSVAHPPVLPAVGYRFDYEGRSVVITGDTSRSAAVVQAARDADVLVHDAMAHHMIHIAEEVAADAGLARNAHIAHDIPEYHASVVDAAEVANEANAKLLILYHVVPPPPNFLAKRIFLRGVDEVRPDGVELAEDGLLIDLPPRSATIERSSLGG